MTERPTTMDWDDDRLAAAFVARDDLRPAAYRLIAPTLELVAAARRPTVVRWVPAIRPALAVIAMAVLIGGVAISGSRSNVALPTVGLTSQPSTARATPASTPSSVPTAGPETALGLPIITVADAIAVRDAGVDDRELAVRAWFMPVTIRMFCPFMQHQVRPVQLGCGDGFNWLTQEKESVLRTVGGTTEYVQPKSPAIHPSFDLLGGTWPTYALRLCAPNCQPGPTSIVAIGHFDDRHASGCKASERTQCEDRFVVDRVDSMEGHVLDLSVEDTRGRDRIWTMEDIDRLDPLGPNDSRLSVQVVNGRDKSLSIEPTLASDPAWSKQPAVWLVRDLIGDRAVTRVIADGAHRVHEIEPDGTVTVLG
jgi:hypothetical protein